MVDLHKKEDIIKAM